MFGISLHKSRNDISATTGHGFAYKRTLVLSDSQNQNYVSFKNSRIFKLVDPAL